ncbi:Ctr copper transporter, partial [Microstroma glucosiphilum]
SCSMSMTFNTSYKNLCLIFPSWRLTTASSLYLSLLVIVGLCVGYEWLRLILKRLDRRLVGAARRRGASAASAPLLGAAEAGGSRARSATRRYDPKVKRSGEDQSVRSIGYAIAVAYSYTLMLLFMTYNAYVISAIIVGAALGHYLFNR